MKLAQKVLSSLLAAAMAVTTATTFVFADDAENLMIVEDFNSKSVGTFETPVQLFERWGTQPIIGERDTDNKWLKITSRGGDGFVVTQKGTEDTAEALVLYAKTNDKKVEFMLTAIEESGAQFNMQVAGATVAYSLIDAEGAVTNVSKVDKITLPENFEGWIVLTIASLPYQHGGEKHSAIVPSDIRSFVPYVIDVPEGAELYMDDIGFVKNMQTFIDDHKASEPPKTDDKPADLDFFLGQGFGTANVGDDETALNAKGIIWNEPKMAETDSLIEDGALGYGNSLKVTFSSTGSLWEYDIKTNFSEADRTALAADGAVDSLVFRIKTPSYSPFKNQIMLMEGLDNDLGSVGEMYYPQMSAADSGITATFVDAKTKQYTTLELAGENGVHNDDFLSGDFDGWVILPLDFFRLHTGNTQKNKEFDPELLTRVRFGFIEAQEGAEMKIDNIGLAKKADFMTSLGAQAKPVDKVYNMEVSEIVKIPAADFTFAKENNVNLDITVNDGYPIYNFVFEGTNVGTPADFDPTILFDFDEISDIEGLTKDLTARFFKVNAMPGTATLKLHTDDVVSAPYLYKYDANTKKITLVIEDTLSVDDESMCAFGLEEGGIYFLSDEKVVMKDGSTVTPEKPNTPNEDKPSDTGVNAIGFVLAVMILAGGATVAFFSKKRGFLK